jgi:hypothetical protein
MVFLTTSIIGKEVRGCTIRMLRPVVSPQTKPHYVTVPLLSRPKQPQQTHCMCSQGSAPRSSTKRTIVWRFLSVVLRRGRVEG